MRGLRELVAIVGVLALAFAFTWAEPRPAMAKGQGVVLLNSPTTWQTAALYDDDARYQRLKSLLGHDRGRAGHTRQQRPPKLGTSIGRQVTVTWMAHNAWRVDRVYPGVPGTRHVWILTEFDLTRPTNDHTWRKAEHPAELRALLTKAGRLMGKQPDGSYPDLGATQHPIGSAAPSPGVERSALANASAGAPS
ncbi:hypothetical protein ACFQVC_32065 [Streptomyces monticola]|uniref:Uncharacterized protein n=1 Tax=Streptomyces monticola TaxID=2666263 RepID=A0ABW2JTS6_9ACTN